MKYFIFGCGLAYLACDIFGSDYPNAEVQALICFATSVIIAKIDELDKSK